MAPSRTRRWLRFNAVGLAGMAVQLGCLAALVHGAGMHYLPATVLAVEAAVLHNFAWHQRWTWRDRPAAGRRAILGRFARFQALNGAISLVVNSGAMLALAGAAGLDPVVAGVVAIGLASLINFLASDAIVFPRSVTAGVALLLLPLPALAEPGDPSRAATDAWMRYQAAVDARYDASAASAAHFFALDDAAGTQGWRVSVLGGGIPLHQIEGPALEGARIHHWVGAVFVPGMTVARVVEHLQRNAGSEARTYEDVIESRLLARNGDRLRVFMKLRRAAVITATFNTEHDVEYRRLGSGRASSRSVATRIAELADAGTSRERERAPGDDRGLLWRLNAYWRFEQVAGGVIIECESVSLSREVPVVLRPVAGGIIRRVAREALEGTLLQVLQSFNP